MLVYWLPWPGKRKAILPAGAPLPRKMPWAASAFQAWGLSKPAALRALASFSSSSPGSPKSITSRSGWRSSAGSGGAMGGAQPPSACRQASSSRSFSATGLAAPMARMPRTGFLALEGAGTASGRAPSPWLAGVLLGRVTSTAVNCAVSGCNMPGTYSSSTTWKLVPPKP